MKTREPLSLLLIFLLSTESLRAESATWNRYPDDWNWTTATNWTPATAPNDPDDTATFGQSNVTGVIDWGPTQLDGIVFDSGTSAPSAFTIAPDQLTISGAGITNNSGITQIFFVGYLSPPHPGTINFTGGAKAGIQTVFTNENGTTQFFDHSTADSGTFRNNLHGGVSFFDNSTAGNGTFINVSTGTNFAGTIVFQGNSRAGNGTFQSYGGGTTIFGGASTAENGIFTNNPSTTGGRGGITYFLDNSTADNGIFINNDEGYIDTESGLTSFQDDSSGGTAQIRVFGYGTLAIYSHNAPGVTIGSLEGDGNVQLGSNRLRIGNKNLSTTFSGYIGQGGSIEKIGSGTLTLFNVANYADETLVSAGTLKIEGFGLGVGNVSVTTSEATLRLHGGGNNYIGDTAVLSIVSGSTVDLIFSGTDRVLALVVDGVMQPAGIYGSAASGAPHPLPEFTGSGMIQATTGPRTPRTQATNLSTRLLVGTGDSVTIGGFIIAGAQAKTVAIRGIGPSLARYGLTGLLADPVLEVRDSTGAQLVRNDGWLQAPGQAAQLVAVGQGLQDPAEAGIVTTLQPGAYTAILAGSTSVTGIGLVEMLDIDLGAASQLSNVSSRGLVESGDQVMIGGFILGGNSGNADVIVRGIGPSLAQSGLDLVLADPTLELRDSDGGLLVANDNWQDDPVSAAQLIAHGIAPPNSLESGIFATLAPGPFTALLAGKNGGAGIGLVEVYDASLIGATPPPPPPTPTPVPTPTDHHIVTNPADTGTGTLREAIAIAQDNALIEFNPLLNGQTITISGSELAIDRNLTINGPGADLLTVARDSALQSSKPIFRIMPGRTVTIRGLTISGATPYYGVIVDAGAIVNYGGNVTIESCTLSHNEGAIHNEDASTMLVINCSLTENGPAIFNQGALDVRNSLLTGNSAHIGAAIWNYGSVIVTGSTLSENRSGAGGAIWNWSTGTITVTDSTISGNSVFGYRYTNGPSAPGIGGGIDNGGNLIIVNSTISGNSASSIDTFYFHGGYGGAIYNWGGTLNLANSTFSGNHTAVSDRGGGILVSSGTVQMTNTIMNAGTIGANLAGALGNILSGGYNLSSDDGAGVLAAAEDQINTDPLLGPLQDNGGPTLTHELLAGSPGVDAGDPGFMPPPIYDQRGLGYNRVYNGRVDIGSFERQPCCPSAPTPASRGR